MDLQFDEQCAKVSSTIGLYCHSALKFNLSVERAVDFFISYLAPKLELPLRFVQPTSAQCDQWDAQLGAVISQLAGSPRAMKTEAIAVALGLLLPSSLERRIKISEACLCLNSSDEKLAVCGRRRWQSSSHGSRPSAVSRAVRTSVLARSIDVSFTVHAPPALLSLSQLIQACLSLV